MSGFPEGTVIIRDVRDGLVRQMVMLPNGVRHNVYVLPEDWGSLYAPSGVELLERQRAALAKARFNGG